ncbi:MAG: hypothetical protein IT562_10865 [Alphaproteobacteria bacterium]|nr:hypothetical protein [Alphaproteobacteria bacterium]
MMRALLRTVLTLAAVLGAAAAARAQVAYPDASGTSAIPGQVILCISSSSIAVPCDSTNPLTVTTTAPTGTQDVNLDEIGGTTVATGNGVAGAGAQRVTIASDNTPFAVKIDQTTPGTTNKVSIGTDGTVAVGTALPAGSNSIGTVQPGNTANTTPWRVTPRGSVQDWTYSAAAGGIVNTTTAVTIKTAGSGSDRNCITGLQVAAEALGTATELVLRDGSSGTNLWRVKIGTGGLAGGMSVMFQTPLCGTAATLLEVATLTASGTGAVYVNAQGYTAP